MQQSAATRMSQRFSAFDNMNRTEVTFDYQPGHIQIEPRAIPIYRCSCGTRFGIPIAKHFGAMAHCLRPTIDKVQSQMSQASDSISLAAPNVFTVTSAAAAAMDLYDAHGIEAFRFAYLLTGNRTAAEDVLERVFAKHVTEVEFVSRATRHGPRVALMMAVWKEFRSMRPNL